MATQVNRLLATAVLTTLAYMGINVCSHSKNSCNSAVEIVARSWKSDERQENQALEYSKKSGICCNCCSCCEKLKSPKRDKDPSVKK